MEFRVPKFLERESTIAWGLTFKDLAVLGVLGLTLFGLFYILPKGLFIFVGILMAGVFIFFNFVRIRGQSVQEVLFTAVQFFLSNKTYIWQKKEGWTPIKLVPKKQASRRKKAEDPLRMAPQSRLYRIHSKIDITEIIPEDDFFEEDLTDDDRDDESSDPTL